ncbi:hypothetical protein [Flavonifractor sp. An82]|nr:hypothetical protein [Flavonifractor sp. An82]
MSKTREQRRQAAKTRDTIYAAIVLIGVFVVACALPNWMDILVH